jgi:hypothetical protein
MCDKSTARVEKGPHQDGSLAAPRPPRESSDLELETEQSIYGVQFDCASRTIIAGIDV